MRTPEGSEDEFGFGVVRTKERISQIRPSAPPESNTDLQKLDEIAASAGFISREIPQATYSVRRGRPPGPEAFQALNMRAPESLATAFKRWCDENRHSYPGGLAEIMRRAGIPTK